MARPAPVVRTLLLLGGITFFHGLQPLIHPLQRLQLPLSGLQMLLGHVAVALVLRDGAQTDR